MLNIQEILLTIYYIKHIYIYIIILYIYFVHSEAKIYLENLSREMCVGWIINVSKVKNSFYKYI